MPVKKFARDYYSRKHILFECLKTNVAQNAKPPSQLGFRSVNGEKWREVEKQGLVKVTWEMALFYAIHVI